MLALSLHESGRIDFGLDKFDGAEELSVLGNLLVVGVFDSGKGMIGKDPISKWVATSAHSFGCDCKLFLVEGDFSSGARFHTPLVIIRVLWSFMNSAAAGGEVIGGGEADRGAATFDRDHALNISFSV